MGIYPKDAHLYHKDIWSTMFLDPERYYGMWILNIEAMDNQITIYNPNEIRFKKIRRIYMEGPRE